MGVGLLRKYPCWAIDGTFFCSPKSFYQLFTINVFIGDSSLPCFYALLPNKSEETYLRMFQSLHGYDNFELAPVNALLDVFGDQFDVNFCLFHLSKNAFAHVQWKQLQPAYNDDSARVLFRSLVALSFLPIKQVEIGFEEVREELLACQEIANFDLSINLEDYMNYFERTYIRGRKCGKSIKDALFPIADWNQNKAALSGLPRTNNHMEGWHQAFNARYMPLIRSSSLN
uniref:MULE transposase domain-containing protein n=1 Tax=Ditylenchus dipsaci TaxID=166011 RepID=A0A915CTD3_9BILA